MTSRADIIDDTAGRYKQYVTSSPAATDFANPQLGGLPRVWEKQASGLQTVHMYLLFVLHIGILAYAVPLSCHGTVPTDSPWLATVQAQKDLSKAAFEQQYMIW
jgi:hypothetical protein